MAEEEEVEGGEEGEEKPAGDEPPPPPSEIHVNLTENAKFVASKLDSLFATVAKIQVKSIAPHHLNLLLLRVSDEVGISELQADLAAMEIRLRVEFDEKIRVHHQLAMTRIVALEDLCAIYGIKSDDQKRTQDQQAMQLDDLQNQVGILFFRFH